MPRQLFRMVMASHILMGRRRFANVQGDVEGLAEWKSKNEPDTYGYLEKEMKDHPLHPVFEKLEDIDADIFSDTPNWIQIIAREWPHRGAQPGYVTYTPGSDKGMRGIHQETKLGKYLKRVFPTIPEPTLEILSQKAQKEEMSTFSEVKDDQLINTILKCKDDGPRSCMVGPRKSFSPENHPYRAYSSQYGWSMWCHTLARWARPCRFNPDNARIMLWRASYKYKC